MQVCQRHGRVGRGPDGRGHAAVHQRHVPPDVLFRQRQLGLPLQQLGEAAQSCKHPLAVACVREPLHTGCACSLVCLLAVAAAGLLLAAGPGHGPGHHPRHHAQLPHAAVAAAAAALAVAAAAAPPPPPPAPPPPPPPVRIRLTTPHSPCHRGAPRSTTRQRRSWRTASVHCAGPLRPGPRARRRRPPRPRPA